MNILKTLLIYLLVSPFLSGCSLKSVTFPPSTIKPNQTKPIDARSARAHLDLW